MDANNQLIHPEVGCESFEAGGQTWTRSEGLCLGRAKLLQRFQTELQFDMSIPAVQKVLVEIAADFNGNKLLDGMHKFKRLMDGSDILGANRFRQAEVVALFYNGPGEDAADSSYDLIKNKVGLWGSLDAAFFTKTAYYVLLSFWQRCQPTPPAAEAPAPSA